MDLRRPLRPRLPSGVARRFIPVLRLLALVVLAAAPAGAGATAIAGSGAAQALTPPVPASSGPVDGPAVKPVALDTDLRSLPQAPVPLPRTPRHAPQGAAPARAGQSPFLGAQAPENIQSNQPGAAMPPPTFTFEGVGYSDTDSHYTPADPNGDAGPTYYIQAVNLTIGIYDKSSGSRLVLTQLPTLFAGVAGCHAPVTNDMTDPGALYDTLSGRWLISVVSANYNTTSGGGPTYLCLAVSKTADPVAGGWFLYGIPIDATDFSDNPQVGLWSDGIYVSVNRFTNYESIFEGARVWALNRAALIGGLTAQTVYFDVNPQYFGLMPSNLRGTPPPSGAPNYLVAIDYSQTVSSALLFWKMHVDWSHTASSSLSSPARVTVNPYTHTRRSSVPQPNTFSRLDNRADWLMHQAQYRNIGGVESLWISRTAVPSALTGNYDGPTAAGWYELRNLNQAPFAFQQGVYMPDATYRWMGSLAVDKRGDMAIGYSASSSTVFPSLRYAGRLVNDPPNTLGQAETVLYAGGGSQTGDDRWGDYSGMVIDPVDECTFWYTNVYYPSSAPYQWHTRIGAFKFPSCTPTPPPVWLPVVIRN